jgi:hypothetical protein
VLCFRGRAMTGVLVSLEVLAVALLLMSRFGVRAGGARVPFFDVESTSVAVVPIRKMFDGVGVGCSWLLAVGCRHLVVRWWYITIRIVVAIVILGGGAHCVVLLAGSFGSCLLVLYCVDCRLDRSSFGLSVACDSGTACRLGWAVACGAVAPFVPDGGPFACCT